MGRYHFHLGRTALKFDLDYTQIVPVLCTEKDLGL